MKREDRETVLIVAIIMIVSTISVVAVSYLVWQIIGPPLVNVVNRLQYGVAVNQTNYNFIYPGLSGTTSTSNTAGGGNAEVPATTGSKNFKPNNFFQNKLSAKRLAEFLANPDYNFSYPDQERTITSQAVQLVGMQEELISVQQFTSLINYSINIETRLSLEIPRLAIKGKVTESYDPYQALNEGFWVYPGSKPIGEGTTLILCYRYRNSPLLSHSCWYLNEIAKGDEIIISKSDDVKQAYKVVKIDILNSTNQDIYKIDETNVLKIVTSNPLGSTFQRIVVYALPAEQVTD